MLEAGSQFVLIVDDSADIHKLVGARLRSERVSLLHAYNAAEGVAVARHHLPDLILLDLDMPDTDGMALCRQLKDDPALTDIPVIFLTGTIDVSTKVRAFELGAVDYVTKPFDAIELKARVRSALRTKHYHDLLATRAQIDALTGLWNRGYLDQQLKIEISACSRRKSPVSLVMADIDHFKAINDTYGHPFGDIVIECVAEALTSASRDSDVICRYGGEEFALILQDTAGASARCLAERMRAEIAALTFEQGREQVRITASFGVADTAPLDEPPSPEALRKAADSALYRAKSNGRNRVENGDTG